MHLHSFLFPLKKEAPVAGQDTGGKGTAVTSNGPVLNFAFVLSKAQATVSQPLLCF